MLRRLDKRGMDDKLMFMMWEIIVIVMVVIILTIAVRGISNNTTYWKKYHSTDLAMMSDLMLTNQGDFVVNYNMKEMRQNFVTRLLYVDKLVFVTMLKSDTFYLYESSVDEDRFPQMYTFATYKGITINDLSISNDYLILYKVGDTLGIKEYYTPSQTACPSANTQANLSSVKFESMSVNNSLRSYTDVINQALSLYGKNSDAKNDLLIVITSGKENNVYFDTTQPLSSGKMSCLLTRELAQKLPESPFKNIPYDGFLDDNADLNTKKANYNYWIIIQTDGKMSAADMMNSIDNAVKKYYS